jgi:hypothetical protein
VNATAAAASNRGGHWGRPLGAVRPAGRAHLQLIKAGLPPPRPPRRQWQVDGLCVNVRKGMLLVASVVSAAAPHVVLGTGEGAHLDGAPLEAHGHVVHQAQVQQGDVLCVMR